MKNLPPGMRTFFLIWSGQVVSNVGSSLTAFVLGVWVYQGTGSATQFALIAAAATIPTVLLAPFTGALVDRWDRRLTMIVADFGAAASTVVLLLLFSAGRLEVWHIWIAAAFAASCNALQNTAYSASIRVLVPREHLARMNGLAHTAQALSIIAPVLAAALIHLVGVTGVMAIDLGTFAYAVVVLLAVRIPRPAASAGAAAARGSLLREMAYGYQHLRGRPALLRLAALFAFFNFFVAMAAIMVQPLILSFADVVVLGTLMLAGGAGMLAGSLAMGAWGGTRRKLDGMFAFAALGGVALFLHGLAPSAWLIAFAAPLFLFTVPVVSASFMHVIQGGTAPDVQGRVVAMVRMLASATVPVAYLAAGPMADHLFEPLMATGGALAGSVGAWIGTGQGRGIALMFMVSGVVCLGTALVAALSPALRRAEDEAPEPEPAAEPAAGPLAPAAG